MSINLPKDIDFDYPYNVKNVIMYIPFHGGPYEIFSKKTRFV